jgi:SAM-dependent methyltransferase
MSSQAQTRNDPEREYDDKYWETVAELDGTPADAFIFENLPASDFVLDAGCGTGRFLKRLEDAVGVDLFAPCTDPRFLRASLFALPFRDGVFDSILCNHAIEHVGEPARAIREFRRVLKPEGRLVFAFPNSNYLLFLLGLQKQHGTHIVRFSSFFSAEPNFRRVVKRVFLPRANFLSRIPLLRDLSYNVVLVLERRD